MSVIYLVLPLALLVAAAAVAAFVWAAKNGQFDDLSTPGIRVAFDDDDAQSRTSEEAPRDQELGEQRRTAAGPGATTRSRRWRWRQESKRRG